MKREEKIAILKDIIDGEIIHPQVRKSVGAWAIEELEQQPCGDAISRHAVLDVIDEEWICNAEYEFRPLVESIKQLPSVRPKQEIVRCSQCKYAEVADSEDSQDGYTCQFHRGSIWFSGSYCSWAERRQDG